MSGPNLKVADSSAQNSTPPRPPTERERKDVVIKWLSSLLANLNIPADQADLFPELKTAMDSIAVVTKSNLKELL